MQRYKLHSMIIFVARNAPRGPRSSLSTNKSSTDRHFFSSIFFSITCFVHFIVTFNKDGKERTCIGLIQSAKGELLVNNNYRINPEPKRRTARKQYSTNSESKKRAASKQYNNHPGRNKAAA